MLEYLEIDPQWILSYRTDFLTMFFKSFPMIFSEYFYLCLIALGYWINLKKNLFPALGFLVPFSIFTNCLLKNIFQIPRPDEELHLVPINDAFGFPSGDTQLATIFWLAFFFNLTNSRWRYLFLLPIIGVATSRIYLGVHSIIDVIAGFVTGIFILWICYPRVVNSLQTSKDKPLYKEFFLLISVVGLYIFISQDLEWPPIALISIGAMTGFVVSLPWLRSASIQNDGLFPQNNTIHLTFGLIALLIIIKFTPVIKTDQLYFYATMLVKYITIMFSIFVLLPGLRKRI